MTALQQACSQLSGTKWREKAERHQGKHFPIALHQLGEKPGTESCEYLVQHIQRSGEVGIAEKYPTETNEVKRDYDAEEAADAMTALSLFLPVMPIQNLWAASATPCNIPKKQNSRMRHATSHPKTW